jgi:hypothetical protein
LAFSIEEENAMPSNQLNCSGHQVSLEDVPNRAADEPAATQSRITWNFGAGDRWKSFLALISIAVDPPRSDSMHCPNSITTKSSAGRARYADRLFRYL